MPYWLKDVCGLCRAIVLEQCIATLPKHQVSEAQVLVSQPVQLSCRAVKGSLASKSKDEITSHYLVTLDYPLGMFLLSVL